jgi:hypothetical protein
MSIAGLLIGAIAVCILTAACSTCPKSDRSPRLPTHRMPGSGLPRGASRRLHRIRPMPMSCMSPPAPVIRLFLAFLTCLLATIGHSHGASVTSPFNVTVVPPSPTVRNFTIDPDPSKGGARGDVLEKTVDYFTDPAHTNPSVIVGYGTYPSGSGGLWLYTNDGSATGQWTSTSILSSGNCYERSRAITFPGQTYPNLVASCNDKVILFLNPGNAGGNPVADAWPQQVLDGTQGAHQIRIADIDGDGKQDIVLSASAILGVSPNFILYQNSPTSWTRINGPLVNGSGSLQDDVDVITVNGATSIVGPAADGSGVYWFSYPGSRSGAWPTHLLAAAGTNSMKGVAVSGGTLNGKSYVILAANEDYPNPWPSGLVYYAQPSDPTQLWVQTSVDSTYRAVHEISSGSFGAGPYFIAAEEEQACVSGQPDYHASVGCRVTLFQFAGNVPQQTQLDPQLRGTQNQSVIPWQGGILVVGANHQVYHGYPPLQGWIISEP